MRRLWLFGPLLLVSIALFVHARRRALAPPREMPAAPPSPGASEREFALDAESRAKSRRREVGARGDDDADSRSRSETVLAEDALLEYGYGDAPWRLRNPTNGASIVVPFGPTLSPLTDTPGASFAGPDELLLAHGEQTVFFERDASAASGWRSNGTLPPLRKHLLRYGASAAPGYVAWLEFAHYAASVPASARPRFDPRIVVWDRASGRERCSAPAHVSLFSNVAFAGALRATERRLEFWNGGRVVYFDPQSCLQLAEVGTSSSRHDRHSFPWGERDVYLPDCRGVTRPGRDCDVLVVDFANGRHRYATIAARAPCDSPSSIGLSPDGALVAFGGNSERARWPSVCVYDLRTRAQRTLRLLYANTLEPDPFNNNWGDLTWLGTMVQFTGYSHDDFAVFATGAVPHAWLDEAPFPPATGADAPRPLAYEPSENALLVRGGERLWMLDARTLRPRWSTGLVAHAPTRASLSPGGRWVHTRGRDHREPGQLFDARDGRSLPP